MNSPALPTIFSILKILHAKISKYIITTQIRLNQLQNLNSVWPIGLWSKRLPQMETILNMMRTLRNDNSKTAYNEIHGPFYWNKAPLVPLDNKGMVYITPNARNAFAPYCNEAFTVDRALFHHQLPIFSHSIDQVIPHLRHKPPWPNPLDTPHSLRTWQDSMRCHWPPDRVSLGGSCHRGR